MRTHHYRAAGGRRLSMYDSHKTLATAEHNVRSAVDEAFAAYLRQVRRAVLDGHTTTADASPADLPPNMDAWPNSSVWAELARRFILPAIAAAFGLAFDTAARADLLEQHRYQQTFMDEVFDRLSRSLWPDTAFEMVRGDLAEGLDAGESVPQLRDRVAAALDVGRYSYLAERIARTESHTATEGGSWSAHMAWAELAGEELFKLWDSTHDGRTRLTHRVANNQIVALSDRFTVGGAGLLYPGDPSAPPQESINCRCSTLVGSRAEMRDYAGLGPEEPPLETPAERIERILAEGVTGDEAMGQVFSAADLIDTQRKAFVRYTGSAYMSMNKAIRQQTLDYAPQVIARREGRNATPEEIATWDRLLAQAPTVDQLVSSGAYASYEIDSGKPEKDAKTFAGMNAAFATADPIKKPVRLYRGISDVKMLMGRTENLVGLEFADAAVVSSSADESVAEGFGMGGAVMEVLVDAGTPAIAVAAISQYPTEQEIIFPQGTRFRVVTDEDRGGTRYLQVEPVGAPGWTPTPRTKTPTAATTAAAGDAVVPAGNAPGTTGSWPTPPRSSSTTLSWTLKSPTTVATAVAGETSNTTGGPVTETVAEPTAPEAPTDRLYWRAAMVPLDTRADYRIITTPADGKVKKTSLSYLMWQERTAPAHDDAVTVGRADRVWIQDGWLWGEGEWDLKDPEALRVIDKIERDFAGTLSVDLRDGWSEEIIVDTEGNVIAFEDLPDDFDQVYELFESGQYRFMERIHDWRFEGVTLVQSPAYYTSRIWIVRPEQGAVTAAATGQTSLPLADRDREWDGDAAKRRLADAGRLNAGCFWRSDEADPDSDIQNDYKLPFADIIDGELVAVPRGIFSVAGVLQGAMGGVDIPEEDKDTIRDRVAGYYEAMASEFDDPDLVAPWEEDDDDDDDDEGEDMTAAAPDVAVLTAAAGIATDTTTWAEQVAANIPLEPPAEWFTDPGLTGPTKVRVTDHGRVYGHVATWDTDHVGFPGQSVRPPRSNTDYAHYRRNRVRCADGTEVWTGALVMGTGHADTRVSSASAMAHYDDTGYNVADVVCGEDEYGIWFSGCLRPGSSPLQVLTLDRYSVSGDWRGGELVGVCVVNVPGFPISENELSLVAAASGGGVLPTAHLKARYEGTTPVALVASGVLVPERTTTAAVSAAERAELERIHQRLDQIPDQVYSATIRAQREAAELEQAAKQITKDAVEAMAHQMGVI